MRNFKDESFIAQYLSPKLIREFHFFAVLDDDNNDKLAISAIHDEARLPLRAPAAGRAIQPRQPRAEHPGLVRSIPATTAR
jgi:hypothetical protein